jgi:hypothetical protein
LRQRTAASAEMSSAKRRAVPLLLETRTGGRDGSCVGGLIIPHYTASAVNKATPRPFCFRLSAANIVRQGLSPKLFHRTLYTARSSDTTVHCTLAASPPHCSLK